MRERFELKFDAKSSLVCYIWQNKQKEEVGCVQIAHGISEHITRYDEFANYLADNGFTVIGADHYQHGESCKDLKTLGIIEDYDYIDAVNKGIHLVRHHFKEHFSKKSCLFAHSMGSIAAQTYIQTYPKDFEKIILCGTDCGSIKYNLAKLVTSISVNKNGKAASTKLIHSLSFGAYQKKFKEKNEFNWLSKNLNNIKNYENDPLCGAPMPDYATYSISNALTKSIKTKNIKKIDKDVSIFLIAGSKDPVAGMGKSVIKLYKKYKKNSLKVSMKLYNDLRHEILNEEAPEEIYKDILNFYQK